MCYVYPGYIPQEIDNFQINENGNSSIIWRKSELQELKDRLEVLELRKKIRELEKLEDERERDV